MPAPSASPPKASKLPLLLMLGGGAAIVLSLLLGVVGGFFHWQAGKAYRAYTIINSYVGYGSSLADIPYRKYKTYSTIRTISWAGSGLFFMLGAGGLVGGIVTRSKRPAAAPAAPAYSGQMYQPEGNPSSAVPTAPSPGAPPPSAAVSSNAYGAPPPGFGAPTASAPPGPPPPPQEPPASFQPTAASPQPMPTPAPAAPTPASDRKFGGTMLMSEVDPTKK